MLDYIRIACAVPAVKVGDVKKNTEDICAYLEKADHFVRRSRPRCPNSGGQFDALYVFGKYGIVPEEAYRGLNYGTSI